MRNALLINFEGWIRVGQCSTPDAARPACMIIGCHHNHLSPSAAFQALAQSSRLLNGRIGVRNAKNYTIGNLRPEMVCKVMMSHLGDTLAPIRCWWRAGHDVIHDALLEQLHGSLGSCPHS